MGSLDNFAWTEVRPGRWERDIDEIEYYYLAVDRQYAETGRHCFAITGHVPVFMKVQPHQLQEECELELEEALQVAWLRLRFDHPTIASWVEYVGRRPRKVYESGGSKPDRHKSLNNWLDSTFRPIFTDMTGLEWCNNDPPVPKLPTLFVLKTSEALVDGIARRIIRRDLVLRASSYIIDGIGTLMLFNNFLKHVAEIYSSNRNDLLFSPTWGEEHLNLSPSFRIAASLPNAISPQQLAHIEDTTASNAALCQDLPILSIPFGKSATIPGKHQRTSLIVSADQTTRILAACRAQSPTVTQAYHAAIAMAARDSQPPSQTPTLKRYISPSLTINERPHCDHPYNTPSHPATLYHSTSGADLSLDLEVPAQGPKNPVRILQGDKTDFARLAPLVGNYYTTLQTSTKSHHPLIPHYFTLLTPQDPRIKDSRPEFDPPPLPPPNPSPSVSLSSFGNIDDGDEEEGLLKSEYGEGGFLRVGFPWVTGEELGTGIGVILGVFGGKLGLGGVWNGRFHGREEVGVFLGRVQEIVEAVLEV